MRARALKENPDAADLTPRERAMLGFARRLTGNLAGISRKDLGPLREAGFDDEAIMQLAAVTGYFNFINRIAIGLGVRLDENLRDCATPDELAAEDERLRG